MGGVSEYTRATDGDEDSEYMSTMFILSSYSTKKYVVKEQKNSAILPMVYIVWSCGTSILQRVVYEIPHSIAQFNTWSLGVVT